MKNKDNENEIFNFAELAFVEDELHKVEQEYTTPAKDKAWVRFGDWYFNKKENREKHCVNKKNYILLTVFLGWLGVHRYYEHRWLLGIIYTLLSFTFLPIAFAFVDLLIAIPMKADKDNKILI